MGERFTIYNLYKDFDECHDFRVDADTLNDVFLKGFKRMTAKWTCPESDPKQARSFAEFCTKFIAQLVDKRCFVYGCSVSQLEEILQELASGNWQSTVTTLGDSSNFEGEVGELAQSILVSLSEFYDIRTMSPEDFFKSSSDMCASVNIRTLFDQCLAISRQESGLLAREMLDKCHDRCSQHSKKSTIDELKYDGWLYVHKLVNELGNFKKECPKLAFFQEVDCAESLISLIYSMASVREWSNELAVSICNQFTKCLGYKREGAKMSGNEEVLGTKIVVDRCIQDATACYDKNSPIPDGIKSVIESMCGIGRR